MEFGLREVTYLSVTVRIVSAFLLGGILGMERELKNRAAGLRTYMLVCVGACMIMLTNQYIYQVFGVGDPVRMGAQVVSGIGFLGAGTIVVTRRNQIKGLTTAAGLWAAAAVGLALGIGFYEAAILGSLLILLIMTLMHSLDNCLRKNTRRLELYVETESRISIGKIVRNIREMGATIDGVQLDREYALDNGTRALIIGVKRAGKMKREDLISAITELDGIIYVEEL